MQLQHPMLACGVRRAAGGRQAPGGPGCDASPNPSCPLLQLVDNFCGFLEVQGCGPLCSAGDAESCTTLGLGALFDASCHLHPETYSHRTDRPTCGNLSQGALASSAAGALSPTSAEPEGLQPRQAAQPEDRGILLSRWHWQQRWRHGQQRRRRRQEGGQEGCC